MFTAEDVGYSYQSYSFWVTNLKQLSQIDLSVDRILEQIDKPNSNKSRGPDGFRPSVVKELKYENAELFTGWDGLWSDPVRQLLYYSVDDWSI